MNRKTGTKEHEGADDKPFAQAVRESAQQIWLAGLGAFAKAQDEGLKVFEALVRQGMHVERRTRESAEEKIGDVAGTVSKVAGDIGRQASESWDRLEHVFESRVERALARMGVPTRGELERLQAQLDALQRELAAQRRPAKAARTRQARGASPAGKSAASGGGTKAAASAPASKPAAAAPRKRAARTAKPAQE